MAERAPLGAFLRPEATILVATFDHKLKIIAIARKCALNFEAGNVNDALAILIVPTKKGFIYTLSNPYRTTTYVNKRCRV